MKISQKLRAAKDPNTLPETLTKLATDENFLVQKRVALNPNTPVEALELLATNESGYVRDGVAQNPNKTELIERLLYLTDPFNKNDQKPIETLDMFQFYKFLNVASVEELEGNYLRPETLEKIFITE
jgi:hypothetical protein